MNIGLTVVSAVSVMLFFPSPGSAAILDRAFNGLEFGQTPEAVIERIEDACEMVDTIRIDPPVIPIARLNETHVLCRNYQTADGSIIKEIVFTFGDNSLLLIEAQGGAVASLSALSESEPQEFKDYVVYFDDLLVTRPDGDAAWLLTQESIFPHMFLWRNPLLSANANAAHQFEPSALMPSVLQFDASIEKLAPLLEEEYLGDRSARLRQG